MIDICTYLWDANENSMPFSRCYDERWVLRLYQGFERNLTTPFMFWVFTEKTRSFGHLPIHQFRLSTDKPSWANCVEAFRRNTPMIVVGLDTIVTGNIDHLAAWCEGHSHRNKIALPRDPNHPQRSCNGVVLAPMGMQHIYWQWSGQNDMEWLDSKPHVYIDDLWPGQVVSYKGHVKKHGLGDARIVYFHGDEKPHQLSGVPWVVENWR